MLDINEIYQSGGISSLQEALEEMYDGYAYSEEEEVNELHPWVMELMDFIDIYYSAFCDYPETILDALYQSSLLKYPEINSWFEALKKESSRKPIKPLWDAPDSLHPLYTYKGHENFILGLVNIPENRFVTSSEDGNLKVWEYKLNEYGLDLCLKAELEAHNGDPINNVAYHPEKKWLATCGDDNIVRLWNSETLEMIAEFTGHTDYVSRVVFSDDFVFSSSKDTRIGVWDLNTLQNKTFLEGHSDWVISLRLSPDRRYLLSVSTNNELHEWDIETFTLRSQINEGSKNLYLDIPGENLYITKENANNRGHRYSPDWIEWIADNKLYSAEKEVIEWDCKTWDILRTVGYDANTVNCFIIEDSFLVTFSHSIRIFNLNSGELIKEYLCPDDRNVKTASLSADKKYLICCSDKGYIFIWDWNSLLHGEYRIGQGRRIGSLEAIIENNDSEFAITGGFVSEACIWNLKTGSIVNRIKIPEKAWNSQANVTKINNEAVIMYKGVVSKLSLSNPAQRTEVILPNTIFEPNIAIGTKNGIILGSLSYQPYYWDLKNNSIRVFDKNFSYNGEFSISPDQRYALVNTYPQNFDKTGDPFSSSWRPVFSPVVLLNLEEEKVAGVFWNTTLLSWIKIKNKWQYKLNKLLSQRYPHCTAWSPDSKSFAAVFKDGEIRIWNAENKKKINKIKISGDNSYISYMQWNEDGLLTILLLYRGEILQLNPKTGAKVRSIVMKGSGVGFVYFYEQGRYWVWHRKDNIVGIFDIVKFENIFATICEMYPYSVTVEKKKLIIGGENGHLCGYDLNGIL